MFKMFIMCVQVTRASASAWDDSPSVRPSVRRLKGQTHTLMFAYITVLHASAHNTTNTQAHRRRRHTKEQGIRLHLLLSKLKSIRKNNKNKNKTRYK